MKAIYTSAVDPALQEQCDSLWTALDQAHTDARQALNGVSLAEFTLGELPRLLEEPKFRIGEHREWILSLCERTGQTQAVAAVRRAEEAFRAFRQSLPSDHQLVRDSSGRRDREMRATDAPYVVRPLGDPPQHFPPTEDDETAAMVRELEHAR